jgi:hypothetical protein
MAQGDQIYVFRELANVGGVYEHHGIDFGDGTVVHYRKPSEIIERTSFETFSRGNSVYLREYQEGFCFIPPVVIQRAESRLGENKYNLLFNNCEHFATWCKTGISNSKQIREFIPIITRLNIKNLSDPLKQALRDGDAKNTNDLLNQALGDIRIVWDRIQPQYKKAIEEIETWQKVAEEALKKNREDLAREALKRKRDYKKKAEELEDKLEHLATMTETLLRNKL